MNAIGNIMQVFNYNENSIRISMIDGEPWWVAKDVCDVLQIRDTGKAIGRLEIDEGTRIEIDHPQSKDKTLEVYVVNEPGLYSLILSSRKKEARVFKRWITHDVIPSIRKTGQYQLPTTFAEALRLAASESERAERAETKQKEAEANLIIAESKLEQFNKLMSSDGTIDVDTLVKILDCDMGRTKMFKFLRENKVLIGANKYDPDWNKPYQKYINNGCFKVVVYEIPRWNRIDIGYKTLIYPKGFLFIINLLEKNGYEFNLNDKKQINIEANPSNWLM